MLASLRFGFLGGFRIERETGEEIALPGRKPRALLAYLILHPTRRHERARLADLLWGEGPEEQALHSLRQALFLVRRAVGDELFELSQHAVTVGVPDRAVDVREFERLALSEDVARLERAVALYRGVLLDGLDTGADGFRDWYRPESTRLHRLAVEALRRLALSSAGAGDTARSMDHAHRLLTLDPADEEMHRHLMRLLAAGGRRSDALRQYRRCADTLWSDLGLDPAAETIRLQVEIRRGQVRPGGEAEGAARAEDRPIDAEAMLARPAIAVLPFSSRGGAIDGDYFADGITEDLLTLIASWRWFPVLTAGSTFSFRGSEGDLARVGRELQADYLVTGSVRRSSDRVRVGVQLVEARTGRCLWAETSEASPKDLFDLQDEIARGIAARLEPQLTHAEVQRRSNVRDLAAYDYLLRGYWYFYRAEVEQAKTMFRRAIDLDPDYAHAYAMLGYATYLTGQLRRDSRWEATLREAQDLADRAVALEENDARAWLVLGQAATWLGHHDVALPAIERAIELNPSLGLASSALSFTLALSGRFREAEAALDRAVRLRPHDKMLGFCLPAKAIARYQVGEYDDALAVARRAVAIQPRFWLGLQMLMASLVQTGATEEIAPIVGAVRAIDADLTAEAFAARVPYRDPAHRLHVAGALRKAGLG